MTRYEKYQFYIDKGYTCNPETGEIFGIRGKLITAKLQRGYIILNYRSSNPLYGHHFIWYWVHGNLKFEELDHINRVKDDNRISNLRSVTHHQNMKNKTAKGYTICKKCTKRPYISSIKINGESIYGGSFKTKEEAIQSYLELKKKYHKIH